MPDLAETILVEILLKNILHELRRALPQPIYRIHKGQVAGAHDYAVLFGWLEPFASQEPRCRCHGSTDCCATRRRAEPYRAMLQLTDSGMRRLAEAQEMHR